jgi:hypothetical protein
MRFAQDAHVIPAIDSSMCSVAVAVLPLPPGLRRGQAAMS